jgi:hypothetical protein
MNNARRLLARIASEQTFLVARVVRIADLLLVCNNFFSGAEVSDLHGFHPLADSQGTSPVL